MSYKSGDDPRLLDDLQAALKRWHRPTLGETALAGTLASVERYQTADPTLTRSNALRRAIRAGLEALRASGRSDEAVLLERRYLRDEPVPLLAQDYHLSERTIYYHLEEAHMALAHALWRLERSRPGAESDSAAKAGLSPAQWRARYLPPPSASHLFGLDLVLDQLLAYLADGDGHWIISLDGMAGLGKTALAREAAGRMAQTGRFADIAWVTVRPPRYTARGAPRADLPTLTCSQILDAMASQLGAMDMAALPLDAKRDRVTRLLRSNPYLVILDNLETVGECGVLPNWFWEMTGPTKFLLTSRHWPALDAELTILYLDQLAEPDALALIRHEAGLRDLPEVAGAKDGALRRILDVTGGNPLAIKLVVGQLVSLPLGHILSTFADARPDTDAFYDHLYRASWDLLSPAARDLLPVMASLPASDATWSDLVAATSLPDKELAAALTELTRHSLVEAKGLEEKRYTLHPLTRHFALRQAQNTL